MEEGGGRYKGPGAGKTVVCYSNTAEFGVWNDGEGGRRRGPKVAGTTLSGTFLARVLNLDLDGGLSPTGAFHCH